MRSLVPSLALALAACSFQHGAGGELRADAAGGDGPTRDASRDAAIDAAPDAPTAFDPAMCPAGYANTAITASPQSRYRVITTQLAVKAQHLDCSDDHPGWTHLVVLDTATEAAQVRTLTANTYYAGGIQARDQASTSAEWSLFTGGALPAATWQAMQPNDNDDSENNEQNFVAADSMSGLLNDVSGTFTYEAICECDGLPVPATIEALIAASAP